MSDSAGAALLAWAIREGASADGCRVGEAPRGGRGVFTPHALRSGCEIFRCPVHLLMRWSDALLEPTIGEALRAARVTSTLLDERALIMLLLVQSRSLGASSPWASYIGCLPGADLVGSLPVNWTDAQLAELQGTAVQHQALEQREHLSHFHATVLVGTLCARWPDRFPPETFSWEALLWAHAMFWSRAIALELPGGREECMVPILDMCNHRPGCLTEFRTEAPPPDCSSAAGRNGSSVTNTVDAAGGPGVGCAVARRRHGWQYVLRAAHPMVAGEEVSINYGAKGNGELLLRHGFVLPANAADVCGLVLPGTPAEPAALTAASGEPSSAATHHPPVPPTTSALAQRALVRLRLPRRHFLFRGGVPALLLPAARVLSAHTEGELEAACRAAGDERHGDAPAAGGGEGAASFDWSLVDWSADDPFAACNAVSAASPVPRACELRALRLVDEELRRRLALLRPPPVIRATV